MKKMNSKASASRPDRSPIAGPETRNVPYALVRPDPDQPRKTFSEASLQELADSIREQGILMRLIVEHVPARFKISEPDLTSREYHVRELVDGVWQHAFQSKDRKMCEHFCAGADNLIEHYRIVAGERRWRAAGIVGLKELPVEVRKDLTPQQRFAIQFIENNQRENITALEEANALKAQLEGRKRVDPKFSPEALAKELGQSRATVYERLKLTRLHAPVREALLAGKISVSLAGTIAVIPLPNQQEKLLKRITNENDYYYPFSVRDVQRIIDEEYVTQLSEAPFDKELSHAIEKGEIAPPCTECPHRTGNMVDQFPDLKARPNVCTKPDCFAQKCKMHWLAKAGQAEKAGKVVLLPSVFKKVSKDYIDAERGGWGVFADSHESPLDVLGKHAPEATLVVTPEGLKKYFKREDLVESAKRAKVKLQRENKPETPDEKAKRQQQEKEFERIHDARHALCASLAHLLAQGLAKIKDVDAWKIMAVFMEEDANWNWLDDVLEKVLVEKAKSDKARVLGTLFSSRDIDVANHNGTWNDNIVKAWKLAGVDLVAEEKKALPALPLTKAEPKQGKLLEVKRNKPKKGAKK